MCLLYLLIIWLTPIILFFPLVYIDMKKGESVKEYVEKYEHTDVLFLLIIPGVNILFIFIFALLIIYSKIGDFRK